MNHFWQFPRQHLYKYCNFVEKLKKKKISKYAIDKQRGVFFKGHSTYETVFGHLRLY